jgi:2,3-diaminopropionate biosynthesis protein SbnB
MIFLNEKDIQLLGINWQKCINIIENAVNCININDFAQPVKPYLRYRNPNNRIIAMPAFIGGDFNTAGIKWIASFPDNINKGMLRANSVTILNNADTGEVISVINTALLSVIRTASVSGLIIKCFNKIRPLKDISIGIIGFGPIGQNHLKMCMDMFGKYISKVFLYDIKPIDLTLFECNGKDKIIIAKDWQEAFSTADIVITCTVSGAPYINKKPKDASLQLNVSLRDYTVEFYDYVKDSIIVDDWDEVCRENTDIERFYKEKGLQKENVNTIVDIVCGDALSNINPKNPIMFNPMGMAVFDMAVGSYYLQLAQEQNVGYKD